MYGEVSTRLAWYRVRMPVALSTKPGATRNFRSSFEESTLTLGM